MKLVVYTVLYVWLVTGGSRGGLMRSNPLVPNYKPDYKENENPLQVIVNLEHQTSKVFTTFIYKPPWLSCELEASLNYTLTVYSGKLGIFRTETMVSQTCNNQLRFTLDSLSKDEAYTAYLDVKSQNNNYSFKSKELYFTTTDVQSAYVITGNHHVHIICLLSVGSTAKGCEVIMQLSNTQSSIGVETQMFRVYRYPDRMEARQCIRLPKTLTTGSIQVFDWKRQGEIGSVQVPSTVIKSMYAPCYVDSVSSMAWKETSHKILFILSAVFMILGSLTIFVGLLCRLGRLHRHFRRDSYKALQGDSIENGYTRLQPRTQ